MPRWDWQVAVDDLTHVAIAYALVLPIGWERERDARSAGLRTFPLVASASCGYVLMALAVFGDNVEALARVIYGLMTGVGFIGGGAIIKGHSAVRGTATAAALWTTGAIGAAVAFDRYEIAVLLGVINFATLHYFRRLERRAFDDGGIDPGGSPGRARDASEESETAPPH